MLNGSGAVNSIASRQKGCFPWPGQLLLHALNLVCWSLHPGRRPLVELSLSTDGQENNGLFVGEKEMVYFDNIKWDKVTAVSTAENCRRR